MKSLDFGHHLVKNSLYEAYFIKKYKEAIKHPMLQKKEHQKTLRRILNQTNQHFEIFSELVQQYNIDVERVKKELGMTLWVFGSLRLQKINKKTKICPVDLLKGLLKEETNLRKIYEYQLQNFKDNEFQKFQEAISKIIDEEEEHELSVKRIIDELMRE